MSVGAQRGRKLRAHITVMLLHPVVAVTSQSWRAQLRTGMHNMAWWRKRSKKRRNVPLHRRHGTRPMRASKERNTEPFHANKEPYESVFVEEDNREGRYLRGNVGSTNGSPLFNCTLENGKASQTIAIASACSHGRVGSERHGKERMRGHTPHHPH